MSPKGMATGRRQGLPETPRRRPAPWQPTPGQYRATGPGPESRRPAGSGCRFQDPVRRVRASRFWLRRARL